MIDTAAFLLESALKVSSTDYKPLVYALYFLESAIAYENNTISKNSMGPSTSLLKNTGLGHVNLIQNKLVPNGGGLFLPKNKDILLTSKKINWPSQRYINYYYYFYYDICICISLSCLYYVIIDLSLYHYHYLFLLVGSYGALKDLLLHGVNF